MRDPDVLRVMSFNLRYDTAEDEDNRWSLRRDVALELIRALDPDVLSVQEALPGQLEDLDRGLPGWSRTSFGRDGPSAGEAVALYARAARFDRAASGGFWLSETPSVPSLGWDAEQRRVAVWADYVEQETGRAFTVLGTHLDYWAQVARVQSARQLAEWAEARDGPLVIAGDFNTAPAEEGHRVLTAPGPRLTDAFLAVHETEDGGTFHGFGDKIIDDRVDWIRHSEHWRAEAAAIERDKPGDRWPSDHYPVTASLRWVNRSPPP